MRPFLLLPLFLAACAAPPSGGTMSCDGRIEVRNAAPIAVEQLYVSTAGPSDWGRDYLSPGTLPAGGTQSVVVRPGLNAVRVVFVNGRAAEMAGMDVCANPIMTVQPNGLQAGRYKSAHGGEIAEASSATQPTMSRPRSGHLSCGIPDSAVGMQL